MIIDGAMYVKGERQPPPAASGTLARRADVPDDSFVWLGMRMPTASEMDAARHAFALHELAVEDALSVHERPKLEFYGDTMFLVLRTARYVSTTDEVESGELCVFVGPWFVLSVRHGVASPLARVRAELDRRPDLARLGPGAVLHGIVHRIVSDYHDVVEELIKDVREIERDVFSDSRLQPTRRIYFLIREVLDFLVAISPLIGPLTQLGGTACVPWVHPEIAPFFRDVHDDLLRLIEDVRTLETLLMSALDANQTQVSIRQNEDMRKISAWVAIAAVPTMVAGIYGMNFKNMPELDTEWGYFVVIGLTALACMLLFRRFKSSGWL
jgi:magnesium transporter